MRKLWSRVTWLTLLVVLAFSSSASPATYYLKNGGTGADPDCSGSTACCDGAYDEAGYNAATFSASDIVKICPHGGNFNLGIDIDATAGVTHEGVYDPQYGWPVFDEGVIFSGSNNTFFGAEIRPGIAESGTKTFEGGRFGTCDNGNRVWEAAEETAITDWDKSSTGFFAVGIGATGGAVANLTPQLYWRDKTDAGAFAAVGATGEVKYINPGGCITDNSDVTSSEAGVASGKIYEIGDCNQCEQEDSHQAGATTDLDEGEWAELQIGVSFADADHGHEYEFSLYESVAQVGPASLATVTVETLCMAADCTGTYDTCWTGEYSGDTDKACSDSGASQVDGNQSGSPIQTNGDVYVTLDANGDYLVWTPNLDSIDESFTITFQITTPGTIDGTCYIAGVWDGVGDYAELRIDPSGELQGRYETPAGSVWHATIGPSLSESTTYNVAWAFDTTENDSYIGTNADESELYSISINPFASAVSKVGIGDYLSQGCSDVYDIDDFQIVVGYDNTQPSAP